MKWRVKGGEKKIWSCDAWDRGWAGDDLYLLTPGTADLGKPPEFWIEMVRLSITTLRANGD